MCSSLLQTTAGLRVRSPLDAAQVMRIRLDRPSIEIDQYTFSLADQADGSRSLIRRTAAGAIQPMVDFVSVAGHSRAPRVSQIDIYGDSGGDQRRRFARVLGRTRVQDIDPI